MLASPQGLVSWSSQTQPVPPHTLHSVAITPISPYMTAFSIMPGHAKPLGYARLESVWYACDARQEHVWAAKIAAMPGVSLSLFELPTFSFLRFRLRLALGQVSV